MKLCKDCKHFVNMNTPGSMMMFPNKCKSVYDLEYGASQLIEIARSNTQPELISETCGSEGKFWEAK